MKINPQFLEIDEVLYFYEQEIKLSGNFILDRIKDNFHILQLFILYLTVKQIMIKGRGKSI